MVSQEEIVILVSISVDLFYHILMVANNRLYQENYNKKHGLTPRQITAEFHEKI